MKRHPDRTYRKADSRDHAYALAQVCPVGRWYEIAWPDGTLLVGPRR
jgi:hypothetical protein